MAESAQSDPRAAYRTWQIKILSATWLAYFGYYFCRKAFFVVKDDLGRDLGLDSVQLAHIGSAYLIGYAVGQFSSAYFGRRLGPRLLLLVGMAISVGCNVLFGSVNGFWTILLFMAINGLAQGTGWPGCIGSLGHWFTRRQRGSILGVWSTCYQLGSLAASSFAAFWLGWLGWRSSFFGAAMVLLLIWGIVWWLHPNTPEDVGLESVREDDPAPGAQAGQATAPGTPAERSLGWTRQVIVTVLLMGAIYFCIKFLRYALWSWAPYFLKNNHGLEGDQAGYLSTVFDLAGFVGVLLAGTLSDRWLKGRRALLSLLMLWLMAGSFVGMYLWGAASVLGFAVSMGLCGFMLYGPDSLLSGVGAIDVGSVRGALVAAGIINGMGSIGPIFQEELIGWMYRAFDADLLPILLMFVGVACAGAVLMFVLWLRSKRGSSKV
jgi:sugar phosphate permease